MGPTIDQHAGAQDSMFEEPADFFEPETHEAAYEAHHEPSDQAEPSYEAAGDFAGETSEPVHPEAPTSGHSPDHVLASAGGETASEPKLEPEPELPSELPSVLTADDFSALEERVLRAVTLVRSERQSRIAAEERVAALEAQLQTQTPAFEGLQQEVDALRREREQVRQRVDRLLSQLDALEL